MFPSIDVVNGGNAVHLADNLSHLLETLPSDVTVVTGHGAPFCPPRSAIVHRHASRDDRGSAAGSVGGGLTVEALQARGLSDRWDGWENPIVPEVSVDQADHDEFGRVHNLPQARRLAFLYKVMRRAILLSFAVALVTVVSLTWPRSTPAPAAASVVDTTFGLGSVVDDFQFEDIDGGQWTLSSYAANGSVVLAMRDALCPVSRRYGPTTSKLAKEFHPQGVKFLFVNVSPLDTREAMVEDRSRYGLNGAYVHDPDWEIARMLSVITTGEVFLLDPNRRMIYRGGIDDQYGIRFTKPAARASYLRDGIEQHLAGDEINRKSALPEGCYLAADVRSVQHDQHETDR